LIYNCEIGQYKKRFGSDYGVGGFGAGVFGVVGLLAICLSKVSPSKKPSFLKSF